VTTKANNISQIEWPIPDVLAFTTTRFSPRQHQPTNTSQDIQASLVSCKELKTAFAAFNLGTHVGDCAKTVLANRNSLLAHLPSKTKIQWLEQVHGNHVVDVMSHSDEPMVADAAITRRRDIALAIMTADCLPILLVNNAGNEIAAIHAGWRPLAANIIEQTIAKMHSSAEQVYAWMGPCIGPSAFEVGQEVMQIFCQISPQFQAAFSPVSATHNASDEQKYFADLQLIATLQLTALGVKDITRLAECTYQHSDKYYSYRRDKITGRMASIICLS